MKKSLYSDLSERAHHLTTVIRTGSDERDVWPVRKRILDTRRVGKTLEKR